MTEQDTLILVLLRRMSEHVDALRVDTREINTRLGIPEQQGASSLSCVDRIDLRLDRIERRLDLVDV